VKAMAVKSPHLLLASSNCNKLFNNIKYILSEDSKRLFEEEINKNVKLLYELGLSHFEFASKIDKKHWRQKISRLYYAAYNLRRAIQLKFDGLYSQDTSDHKNIGSLPDSFPSSSTYKSSFTALRDDRNVCDYDHTATEEDLVLNQVEAETLVRNFLNDSKNFLNKYGVTI
jgi:hypothetical protein